MKPRGGTPCVGPDLVVPGEKNAVRLQLASRAQRVLDRFSARLTQALERQGIDDDSSARLFLEQLYRSRLLQGADLLA